MSHNPCSAAYSLASSKSPLKRMSLGGSNRDERRVPVSAALPLPLAPPPAPPSLLKSRNASTKLLGTGFSRRREGRMGAGKESPYRRSVRVGRGARTSSSAGGAAALASLQARAD